MTADGWLKSARPPSTFEIGARDFLMCPSKICNLPRVQACGRRGVAEATAK